MLVTAVRAERRNQPMRLCESVCDSKIAPASGDESHFQTPSKRG